MQLIDIDQTIFVPVVDETHGGVTVEMKMTVGEFFEKCCPGFAPEVVEAIPVEWIRSQLKNNPNDIQSAYDDICINELIDKWQKEQEAQDDCG